MDDYVRYKGACTTMRSYLKIVFMAVAAAVVLASATGAATANQFSLSEDDIRVVFDPLTLDSGLGDIICDVTLEGTFHSTVLDKEQQLLGYITRAISDLSGCTDNVPIFNPNGSVLSETLPWHISNEGWAGTLPNITEIFLLLRDAGFLILGGINPNCRYIANLNGIVFPEGEETFLQPDEGVEIPSPAEGCPAGVFASAASRVTDHEGTADITVTLI